MSMSTDYDVACEIQGYIPDESIDLILESVKKFGGEQVRLFVSYHGHLPTEDTLILESSLGLPDLDDIKTGIDELKRKYIQLLSQAFS